MERNDRIFVLIKVQISPCIKASSTHALLFTGGIVRSSITSPSTIKTEISMINSLGKSDPTYHTMLVLHPAPRLPDQSPLISQPPLLLCSREVNFRAAIKKITDLSPLSNAPFHSSSFSLAIYVIFFYLIMRIKISIKIKIKCEILSYDFLDIETDCNDVCNFFFC